MVRITLIAIAFLITVFRANAQPGFEKIYGGALPEAFRTMVQTTDESILAAGFTQSFGAATLSYPDFYVVKMNASGDTLWTRAFGTASSEDAYAITEMDDGYVISGWAINPSNSTYDCYAVKTDVNGNKIWDAYYGGNGGDYGASSVLLAGNRLLFGGSTTTFTNGGYDFYLVETDAAGLQISDAHFGSTGTDVMKKIVPATDGGFLLVGFSNSFSSTFDVYVVKVDSNLNQQWSKSFNSPGTDYCYDAIQDAAGNFYLLANQPVSPDSGSVKLIKLDANGQNVATLPVATHAGDYAYGLAFTGNALLIAGNTFDLTKGSEFLLVKTDLNGDTIWTRHYGGLKNEVAFSVLSAIDDAVFIAGQTEGFGDDNFDSYVVRADSTGSIACPPMVSFISSDTAFCEDQTIYFTNTTVSSAPFTWSVAGVPFASSIDAGYYFSSVGADTVTLAACNIKSSTALMVFPKPPAYFTYSQMGTSVSFATDASFMPDTYSWNFGDGSGWNTGSLNPEHTYDYPGTYWVTLSASDVNGCDSSYSTQINLLTGVEDAAGQNSKVMLMPNPFAGHTLLLLPPSCRLPVNATVYDLAGRQLAQLTLTQLSQEISLAILPPGMYFMRLKNNFGRHETLELTIEY